MKYPRLATMRGKTSPKLTKQQIGEDMTIPGQALSLKDIIKQTLNGFPVPMAREEIQLHPDINQVLEGKKYDIPSDAKYMTMSKVQRQRVLNNIAGVKQKLSEKLQAELVNKQKVEQEITPPKTPPPTEPTP